MNQEWAFKTTNGDDIRITVLNETKLKPNPTCRVESDTGEIKRVDPGKNEFFEGYKVEIKLNDVVSTGSIETFKITKLIEMLYYYKEHQTLKVINWSDNPSDNQLKKLMDEYHLYPATEGQVIMETEYMMIALHPPKYNTAYIDLNMQEGFERISNIFRSRIPKVRLLGLGGDYNFHHPFFRVHAN